MDDHDHDHDHRNSQLVQIWAYTSEDALILVIPKSMIIRESPSPRKPGPEPSNWPPRSPHQALLSSPSGRKRVQCAARLNTSPSPSKRRRLADATADSQSESDEDEDEETIQLKLKAIKAQLKLKKLQKAKLKAGEPADESDSGVRRKANHDATNSARPPKVEVPLSPKPQRAVIQHPQSPRRVELGIDKGLRAKEVSLRKAPPPAGTSSTAKRTSSEFSKNERKSFSDRLAESRSKDALRQEKQERIQKNRSKGFGSTEAQRSTDHQQVTNSTSHKRNNDVLRGGKESSAKKASTTASSKPRDREPTNPDSDEVDSNTEQEDKSEAVERFSGFKLSKQKINDSELETALENKELISIRTLLKTVTAPDYELPEVEDDYVVFGIIASKSLPRNHVSTHKTKSNADPNDENVLPPRSKFMVVQLIDLKWEIDLFLFDTAFDRFWKLTVGTVIAILNPGIMPPKPHLRDTGKFSLKIASSEDTLLEIGMSQDLGFCKSIKKDGKQCATWVNVTKTDYCDFHVNLRVEKAKAGRMEINGMANTGMFGNNSKSNGQGGNRGSHGRGHGTATSSKSRGDGLKREGAYFDRSVGETGYVIPREFGGAINTSKMLDAEDYVQGGLSKAERSRKRLANQEKERSLAKALGSQGSGLGSEYMRLKRGDKDSPANHDPKAVEEREDAASLGLVGSNAHAIKLSPSKKDGRNGQMSKAEPMGWGGAFKRGLLSPSRKENRPDSSNGTNPTQPEKARRKEKSPTKQARFVLKEKGIRIPGRQSDGPMANNAVFDDDDDDDLDVV